LLLAPLGLLAARSGKAQSRQEKGRQLLEQALEGLGGNKFLAVRNIVHYGRAYAFYRQRIRGLAKITIYQQFTDQKENAEPDWLPVSRREVYTEKGDYYTLFDHGEGWEITFRGARPLPIERMNRYRASVRHDIFFFLRYRLNEPGMYFYYRGTEVLDNIPTEVVDVTDSESEATTYYLRRSDHLPAQLIYTRRDPKTKIPYEEKVVYSKYREVEGAKVPWNIRREEDGEKTFEMFGRTVEVNPQLDAGIYSLDKSLTVLPEAP
jgi:hypothetical protein